MGTMTKEEMNKFLESIGGLENGFFTGRPPITDSGFFSVRLKKSLVGYVSILIRGRMKYIKESNLQKIKVMKPVKSVVKKES
jgi:hypothetical protein